jgi:hypothetical protein
MGLASKINAASAGGGGLGAPPPGGAPGGYPQQRPPGQQGYPGQAPQGAPGGFPGQAPQGAPRPGGFPGQAPPQGQAPYGQTPQQGQQAPYGQQQPGGFGGAPQQGQQGQKYSEYGAGGQQPGGFGAPPGQQPGQFGGPGQQQGQFGAPGQQQPGQQPGQFGGAPGGYGAPGGGQAGGMGGLLQGKLQKMVQTNRLEAFYPPQALQSVIAKLDRVDFKSLAAKWNMPVELATDLATLVLYDIVIFADDSGSMVFEEGGERINDLKLILGRVAEVATLFDDDGIIIRFMNCNVEGNGIRDTVSAANLVQQVQFNGLTPLGTQLDAKVIRPFVAQGVQAQNLQKPILVIVITDGEPTGEPPNSVANAIKNAKNLVSNSRYGPGAVAFEFAQVGKDQKAQAFLGTLDRDPEIGKMVDATSYYELEAEEYARKGVVLSPELWLVKLMVGAVDPTYDEQD